MDEALRSRLQESLANTANKRSMLVTPLAAQLATTNNRTQDLLDAISLSDGRMGYNRNKRPRPSQSTSSSSSVLDHKSDHTEDPELKFTCIYPGCNRKFKWHWTMQTHSKTHLGEAGRTYKCDECDRGFFTSGCLKTHMKIHSRVEKEFKCTQCEKSYSTAEGLSLHVKNHHTQERKWKCKECPKMFVRHADLKLHVLRKHSTERPFPCSTQNCNKSFACLSELKRHLKQHPKDPTAVPQ